ncbi:translesion DNA synthesis-associated protein ImuA [Cupriavidus necator]|uniref:Translesion DNA synthesis-associated protein ImuA n=1 Tax=Cupriavidus necator TaxID=106590 RepID=A0A367PR25_CUPNE|nr:translesion DNA synthesis-associated protein ImuA [Cupriavidus necator]QQX85244.1 translesion DNA synthesis-associated protein ImuA [Cupriavidus necator]RCJ10288.1 translesion DNA synthesis-associated protein ImuA [Cupriavidus necator]
MSAAVAPESIHPALWRASQLARNTTRTVDTGYPALSAELPGGGWPTGTLVELLVQQAGIGELRLLRPALVSVSKRSIVFLEPPHAPQSVAFANWGLAPEQVLWVRGRRTADSLWAAEQLLRAGTCGALLFWQSHIRGESLRRLHLAAQSGETLFCLMRPLACAQDASPAPLRLRVTPAETGVEVLFIKRRGPQQERPLLIPLDPSPILLHCHAPLVDLPAPTIVTTGSFPTELVH